MLHKRKKGYYWRGFLNIVLVVFVILYFPQKVYGDTEKPSVLFISSYDDGYELVPQEIEGIKRELSNEKVILDTEFMDMKRFNTEENKENFYQMISYKIHHLPAFDAVIVGDDDALQFAVQYQKELFQDIPIVFMGINDLSVAQEAADLPGITGIRQDTSLEDNIKLALSIQPKATKIVALVDETLTGIGDKEQFYENEDKFPKLKFEDIDVSKYTFDEVGTMVEQLDENTILFYLNMYVDKTGEFHPVHQVTRLLAKYSKVPIYRVSAGGMGEGILGGKQVSFEETGALAAKMVLNILNGTSIDSIKLVEKSPSRYYFDYNIMKKFQILEKDLPKDSIFVNKELTFYEKYHKLVQIVAIVFGILVLFSVLLIIDNIRRRILDKKLQENHKELTATYEELLAAEEELRSQYTTIQNYTQEIEILNQKYEIAIRGTNSAVWEMDIESKDIFISSNFGGIIKQDINKHENITDLMKRLLNEEIQIELLKEYNNLERSVTDEINIQIPIPMDETIKWILVRGQGVRNQNGNIMLLHGILLDITMLKEQELYIERMANHDFLTELPNRMYFAAKLKEELEKENPCIVMLLDIDNFKGINDTMGHSYGDQILKDVAERLILLIDENVFVSRFGGDEFLILITESMEEDVLATYIQKVKDVFEPPFILDGKEKIICISMGITRFPEDGEDVNQLIMNADTAMYKVKHTGKNSVLFYNPDMKEELKGKTEIEMILQDALKNNGFSVVYQPQVNVMNGQVTSMEALIRLKYYKISPAEFIAVAEETDLILEIGRFVTTQVVKQIAGWKEEGREPKKVAINFSPKQTRDHNYFNFLQELLMEYHVEPQYIEIEITESAFLDQSVRTLALLNNLRDLGVSLALDDFGTGYSSLSYLTYIPVNKIKLDKSLSDKFLKLNNISVIHSIIALAHSLDLEITAEGIEEVVQYQRLREGGCDYIQGYLFSKPLSKEDVDIIYTKDYMEIIRNDMYR